MEPSHADADAMRARILDTAETLLRRHGLDKLNVVDVARSMNMSHGNVYRHLPSKAALRAAVIHRWLDRVSDQTAAIACKDIPADQRLVEWLKALAVIKQRKVE
jgi:AcrR family transcriptional regulator